MKLISYEQFIKNLPNTVVTAPELNKDTLYRYLELCKIYGIDNTLNNPIIDVGGGFALSKHWFGDDLDLPIYHQMCHAFIPWTFEDITELAPHICKVCQEMGLPFVPDSLTFYGKQPSSKYVIKLNSRRTLLGTSYEDTLSTLNTKRRYKVKQAYAQLQSIGYTNCVADENMLPRISKILEQKYPDRLEYEYAFNQSIWSVASKATCLLLNDESAYSFFIERDIGLQMLEESSKEMQFQAIVQDTSSNAGAQLLTAAIHEFSGIYNYIEPTCKVNFCESSIDIYKRLITNQDNLVNILMIGTEEQCSLFQPPFYAGDKWVIS